MEKQNNSSTIEIVVACFLVGLCFALIGLGFWLPILLVSKFFFS